jgi:O-methyltransferase involved in polyketide biosynthesis
LGKNVQQKINIHETAFVTAAFRAGNSSLSKDVFARLWANEVTDSHADRYCRNVSLHEAIAHCLRNRYFFDTLEKLIIAERIEVMVNFGCGFSMYPYLLSNSVRYVEIDTANVTRYKMERTRSWQREGVLPERDVHFVEADFNSPTLEELFQTLEPLVKNRRSFFLLEGVLFFLGRQDTANLFDLFRRLQRGGDYLGSVSFRPSLEETTVFQKLIDFVEGNLEKNQQFNYQTLPDEFYLKLPDYQLADHQDTLSLLERYVPGEELPEDEVLNEHMYLLQRK